MNNSIVKKQLLEQREKAIIENFASKFNMIKRIDEVNLDQPKSTYILSLLKEKFGQPESFRSSADWGGLTVWSIDGDKFEGIFLGIDDNDDLFLINRSSSPETGTNDEEIMAASGNNLREVKKIIEKALELKQNTMPTRQDDPYLSNNPSIGNQ